MSDFKRVADIFGNGIRVKILSDLSEGARKKIWLQDDKGDVYLYKQNKHHPSGESTYESISEYLAKRIGDCIGVPVVPIFL